MGNLPDAAHRGRNERNLSLFIVVIGVVEDSIIIEVRLDFDIFVIVLVHISFLFLLDAALVSSLDLDILGLLGRALLGDLRGIGIGSRADVLLFLGTALCWAGGAAGAIVLVADLTLDLAEASSSTDAVGVTSSLSDKLPVDLWKCEISCGIRKAVQMEGEFRLRG